VDEIAAWDIEDAVNPTIRSEFDTRIRHGTIPAAKSDE
jgi:hypothetical protein